MKKDTTLWVKHLLTLHWEIFRKYWQKPFIVSIIIIAAHFILKFFTSLTDNRIYTHVLEIAVIIVITWMAMRAVVMIQDAIIRRNLNRSRLDAQSVNTQVDILVKIIKRVLVVIGVSAILITFPQIRELGVSILASAGVAGIILGFAAQKSLGNILAGVQIAFTQPIKIDDLVIVENEFGTVEEINLTYVVVCTFDRRRLIVPINYFLEKTFQNWTRNSLDLFGIVYLEVDYTAPVKQIREALDLILAKTNLWDGKIKNLQVTNAKEKTMELRILVSAANPGDAWDLRCYLREKLIEFLQKNYPGCLPKTRLELEKQG